MNAWQVETQCPQCGAPVAMREAQHLLSCPYCKTRLYLIPKGLFRYGLRPKKPSDELVFLPYWRIRGLGFAAYLPPKTAGRPMDQTVLATTLPIRTASLGVRPQATRLTFAHAGEGPFLPINVGLKKALDHAIRQLEAPLTERETLRKPPNLFLSGVSEGDPFDQTGFSGAPMWETRSVYKKYDPIHTFFLDEGSSLVYLPVTPETGKSLRLMDGVTGTPMGSLDRLEWDSLLERCAQTLPRPGTLPLLCPNCGWDLECDDEGWAVICRGCHQVWGISHGQYVSIPYEIGTEDASNALYLPFWKFETSFPALDLRTVQDLDRFANLVHRRASSTPFAVFAPAFKVRPRLLLQISKALTLAQPETHEVGEIPKEIYPVFLSARKVRGLLPLVVGEIGVPKQTFLPRLFGIKQIVKRVTLAFIPFRKTGYEAVFQNGTILAIPLNALKWGRKL